MAESKQEVDVIGDEEFLFTSESVNEGHPDKLCDLVSDAVLDACLAQDPMSRVACETCTKTGMVMIFGEITTKAKVNYEQVVRDTLAKVGYDDAKKGIDYRTCNVVVAIEEQSPEIAEAVQMNNNKKDEDIGAGDQGHMFGYASDETPELMPLTHWYATQLGAELTRVRKSGEYKWVRPDGKTQVSIVYHKDPKTGYITPKRVHTVVISCQHDETVTNDQIQADLKKLIQKVIPADMLTDKTIYHLNPSGRFTIGGPHGDAGLTGRKIIIDSYGGWGAHGGGAFSGKDPTKVDRSAAYAARWVAKSLVAAKLCKRVLVQVSYSIGIAKPLSVFIDTYGTAQGGKTDRDLLAIVQKNFDLRVGLILSALKLRRPIFSKTACYSHFGRSDPDFTWETPMDLKL